MRLLLSLCLLLASVQAARAQGLTWPGPGSPMYGETQHDSYAAAIADAPPPPAQCLKPTGENVCLSTAVAGSVTDDDGKRRTIWFTGAWAPPEEVLCFGPGDGESYGDQLPCDDRRAIRVFKRVLMPPDIGPPDISPGG